MITDLAKRVARLLEKDIEGFEENWICSDGKGSRYEFHNKKYNFTLVRFGSGVWYLNYGGGEMEFEFKNEEEKLLEAARLIRIECIRQQEADEVEAEIFGNGDKE